MLEKIHSEKAPSPAFFLSGSKDRKIHHVDFCRTSVFSDLTYHEGHWSRMSGSMNQKRYMAISLILLAAIPGGLISAYSRGQNMKSLEVKRMATG